VSAVERDRLTGEEPAQDREALLQARAARARVDAAHLQLVWILATETDAERQPTRCKPFDGCDLTGDRHRVA
jgi:hypothetical protein